MKQLIREMREDARSAMFSEYETQYPAMAKDESPWAAFRRRLKLLRERWYGRFDGIKEEMARWFTASVERRSRQDIHRKLKELGFTVEMRMTPNIERQMKTAIEENAALIKSIPREYLKQVEALTLKTWAAGRDLRALQAANLPGVRAGKYYQDKLEAAQKRLEAAETPDDADRYRDELDRIGRRAENRAALIARDQMNKATNNLAAAEAESVGASKGRWLHIPGVYSSRITHEAFDGKEFDLDTGLYDEDVGRYVKPGELPMCNCSFEVLIPGFQ
jgi:uncharacterized protein with gpF-like domain